MKRQQGPSLFDVIEIEDDKERGEDCKHTHEVKTFTVWEGETWERLTWSCLACGRIRGRC